MGDENTGTMFERVAERIAEDEALRRPFTDAGFQPLFDWALSMLAAARARGLDPEICASHLRSLLQEVAIAAREQHVSGLLPLLRPPLFTPYTARLVTTALGRIEWSDNTDENGRRIAAALREAL